MHIRCPHCHNPIDVVDDSDLSEVACPSCGSDFSLVVDEQDVTATFHPKRGQVAHFELLEKLGMGHFGTVWKAKDTKLDRLVAVKIPRTRDLTAEEADWFLREARSAAQLKHPNIVPVHEVGKHDGQLYITSDFIDGTDLRSFIAGRRLSNREAAELTTKIAEAVQSAHESGVIHRDLKPGNVLIDKAGEPHVADFGLAKRETGEITMTVTGQVLGTPAYMSPEQAEGKGHQADARSDVYSLGVILYELLTGELPFRGDKRMLLMQIANDEPTSPRKLTQVPRNLNTICLKCLRKEPDRRYHTATELADDLRRALNDEPINAKPVGAFERAWLWCRRRPAIAGLLTLIVVLLVGGSAIFYERQNAQYARSLVDSLTTAEPGQITQLTDNIYAYKWWTKSIVQSRFAASSDGSEKQLHLRLALLHFDSSQVPLLRQALLELPVTQMEYLPVIRTALEPYQDQLASDLWTVLHTKESPMPKRFHAGVALAKYQPTSDLWTEEDHRFLVEQLVSSNPMHLAGLLRLLSGKSDQFLPALSEVFVDRRRAESQQVAAANVLARYTAQDSQRLAELLAQASAAQHEILYPVFLEVADAPARARLASLVKKSPAKDLRHDERIRLGKQRAGAAITLLRQGELEPVLDAFRFRDDPEALTQFVHRCRTRGVTPAALLKLLDKTEELRKSTTATKDRAAERMSYGVLLALGEFKLRDLPKSAQPTMVDRLAKLYARDPSSAIHGVTGWLLRHWGLEKKLVRVDSTPTFDHLPTQEELGKREWFVLQFEPKEEGGGSLLGLYFTFVLFPAGQFQMGSPKDELNRDAKESLRQAKVTRPIAVSQTEVTWAQWMAFEGKGRRNAYRRQFAGKKFTLHHPVFGVHWYDSVRFCRWLSKQAGLTESDQCYEAEDSLPKGGDGNPSHWPVRLSRRGFRLLTEAEWEYTCRCGVRTAYGFGNDNQLLANYGWFDANSKWSHSVGRLRPNLRGLFDMHGNLWEWCQGGGKGPTPPEGMVRRFRGGCWGSPPQGLRAAFHMRHRATNRDSSLGFRLAFSPSTAK